MKNKCMYVLKMRREESITIGNNVKRKRAKYNRSCLGRHEDVLFFIIIPNKGH